MRTCLVAIALAALTTSITFAQQGDDLVKDVAKLFSEMTDALKTVKDKASAEAALPRLKTFDKRTEELIKRAEKVELSEDQEKKMLANAKQMNSEIDRLEKMPEVMSLFTKELTFFRKLEEAKVKTARAAIRTLEEAINSYLLETNQLPKGLKALTEGKTPILRQEFVDPWKQPYQYDVAGPKNKGTKPDVWTVTPGKLVIGNWDLMKK